MDLTAHWAGIAAILRFVAAYSLVISEEFTHLRGTPAIAQVCGLSIGLHLVPNSHLEEVYPLALR